MPSLHVVTLFQRFISHFHYLNRCKGKGNSYIDNYIKEIQDTYKIEQLDKEQPMVVNKEKQKKRPSTRRRGFLIQTLQYIIKV